MAAQDMAQMVAAGLSPEAKLALAILSKSHGAMPKTRLQKLAFLIAKTTGIDTLDASPYFFGPFSENLVDALRVMKDAGVVKGAEDQLTKFGGDVFQALSGLEADWAKVADFVEATEGIPDRDLVGMVYDLFPEYTDKSLIRETATSGRNYEVATATADPVGRLSFSDLEIDVKRRP